MTYSIYINNVDGSMSLIQSYDANLNTYEQVFADMLLLDQSKQYSIQFFDEENYSILFPASNDSVPPPSEPIQLTQLQVYQNLITEAMAFGNDLMIQFAAENIILGITQAGKTGPVLVYTSTLINCLLTGSLYSAVDQINIMINDSSDTKSNLSPFITNARLTIYKNLIIAWLQSPS